MTNLLLKSFVMIICLRLVQWFRHTSAVIAKQTTVNHQLYLSGVEGSTTLRSIVHDGDSSTIHDIHDRYDPVHGVIVATCRLVHREIPCWTIVENSLLKFKSVAVSVEGFIIHDVSVDSKDDLLANSIEDRDAVDE